MYVHTSDVIHIDLFINFWFTERDKGVPKNINYEIYAYVVTHKMSVHFINKRIIYILRLNNNCNIINRKKNALKERM